MLASPPAMSAVGGPENLEVPTPLFGEGFVVTTGAEAMAAGRVM